MLTLRATLEPDGHITLPPTVRHEQPVTVLVTFFEEPAAVQAGESAAATLALLRSPDSPKQMVPTTAPATEDTPTQGDNINDQRHSEKHSLFLTPNHPISSLLMIERPCSIV